MDFFLLALCGIPSIGPVTQRRLLKTFGTAEKVLAAPSHDLAAVYGMSPQKAGEVKNCVAPEEFEATMKRLQADGVSVITDGSPAYPEALKDLGEHAPVVLYAKGALIKEDRFALAMVGPRKCGIYGKNVAARFAADLGAMGFTIVSGLARGIDTIAHAACLEGGGRTIAVIGSGIDVSYPPENRSLSERIARQGAVLSEFSPGTRPLAQNFPRRNRLISALSMGVLVVQAPKRSGALLTARAALDQNREVFVVPGKIDDASSEGSNALLRQGARIVLEPENIIEELAPQLKEFIKKQKKHVHMDISDDERAFCGILSREPRHVDIITRQSGMSVPKTLAMLSVLELKGVVKQSEGKMFHLE